MNHKNNTFAAYTLTSAPRNYIFAPFEWKIHIYGAKKGIRANQYVSSHPHKFGKRNSTCARTETNHVHQQSNALFTYAITHFAYAIALLVYAIAEIASHDSVITETKADYALQSPRRPYKISTETSKRLRADLQASPRRPQTHVRISAPLLGFSASHECILTSLLHIPTTLLRMPQAIRGI